MPTAFGYRPRINRNTIQSGLSVCTAVVHNPSGELKPVAFGVEFDGLRYRYKIKSSSVVKESHGIIVFDCEYVDLGRIKTVRLVFDVTRCQWTVG